MDNQRKKNLTTYSIILVVFAIFSFIMLMERRKSDVQEVPKKEEVTQSLDEEIKEEDLETSADEEVDEGSLYEKECKETVKEFISIYHLRDTDDPIGKFEEKGEELLTEPYYNEFKEVVIGENTLPKNGYVHRTVEDLKIYGYYFNEEEKEATLKAKVNSNWLDENNNVVYENELTEYTFLLTNVMGKWKIGLLSAEII